MKIPETPGMKLGKQKIEKWKETTKKVMGRPKMAESEKKKRMNVFLNDVELARLKSEAERLGITTSQVVERIVIKSFYQKFPGKREL